MAEEAVFVARAQELSQLDSFLDRALAGDGQLCFVAGGTGTGKTALTAEFVRRAQERIEELVVATGVCDAQTGAGDAYLPFREMLELLTGNVESKALQGRISPENARRLKKMLTVTVQTLIDEGPDLIGLFVPGYSLMAKVGQAIVRNSELVKKLEAQLHKKQADPLRPAADMDQSQIYEQYIKVLLKLAEHQPLLLTLDDLHWADTASINLLFRLGRRLEKSRLLVVGTYRPEEVAIGRGPERHPLDKVLSELKRYRGDIVIDLDRCVRERGQEFVAEYVDREPNRLDDRFRRALLHHTSGHPLFTVELLHHLQENDHLVQAADGAWEVAPDLEWEILPARIEGVIEERVGRLEDSQRRYLAVASIEGEQFTAEVVAAVEKVDIRGLVRELSEELQRRYGVVESLGVERIGAQRLSRYRFVHTLLQEYLYNSLDPIELSYLHEDVGNALESLYGGEVDTIAVQLARHFERAELKDKALVYLQRAGAQAAARYANIEAADYYSRALALAAPDDRALRYQLLLAREQIYHLLGARPAQEADLAELRRLAEQQESAEWRSEVALRSALHALAVGQYQAAIAEVEPAAALAGQIGDKITEVRARHTWGRALWQAGDYVAARGQLTAALELSRELKSTLELARCLYDLGVVLRYEGENAAAQTHLEEASRIYAAAEDRVGEVRCLSALGVLLDVSGRHGEARLRLEQALAAAQAVGWRYGEARLLVQIANNHLDLGDYATAEELLAQAVPICREIADREGEATSLDALGLAAYFRGNIADANNHFAAALKIHQEMDNPRGQGYTLTHLGLALTRQGALQAAAGHLRAALKLRRNGGSGLVLDTLAALAELDLARDEPAHALTYVDEILGWIGEHGVNGSEFPVWVYLVCYQVLCALIPVDAAYSQRAAETLVAGHMLLLEHAYHIEDDTLHDQFLQQIPHHRALHAAWLAREPAGSE
ncbi:MAG: tetratricopeptide repeat protein [Caldilineaceae bacterium]|nr:tetratricopeptide repeat protein [Caldilineaceae bacterium]